MTLGRPEIHTPILAGKNNKPVPVWARFFTDIFRTLSGLTSSAGSTPTGTIFPYAGSTAPSGWIMFSSGTIGNAASGASVYAHASTADLYGLIWNTFDNTDAPVSGGRGADAATDFAAGKTIGIPVAFCRAIGIAGAGSSLTSRDHYSTTGVESVTLTSTQLGNKSHTHTVPAHTHTFSADIHIYDAAGTPISYNTWNSTNGVGAGTPTKFRITGTAPTITVDYDGVGTTAPTQAHNNIQPLVFFNAIIKL